MLLLRFTAAAVLAAVPIAATVAAGILVAAAGCQTPRSTVEIPACADRIEMEGQATRLSSKRFELDHTFDLPFSRTRLEFTDGKNASRTYDITSSEPDALRAFVGAGAGVVGMLLIGAAVYDVANGREILQERPFYETVFGAGFVGLGTAAIGTGWHPAQRTLSFPDDVCPDVAPSPARSQARDNNDDGDNGVYDR